MTPCPGCQARYALPFQGADIHVTEFPFQFFHLQPTACYSPGSPVLPLVIRATNSPVFSHLSTALSSTPEDDISLSATDVNVYRAESTFQRALYSQLKGNNENIEFRYTDRRSTMYSS